MSDIVLIKRALQARDIAALRFSAQKQPFRIFVRIAFQAIIKARSKHIAEITPPILTTTEQLTIPIDYREIPELITGKVCGGTEPAHKIAAGRSFQMTFASNKLGIDLRGKRLIPRVFDKEFHVEIVRHPPG
jgi:hypothetical protein